MAEMILLIDGMYLTFSSFYSHRNMRTLQGEPTGAVYGFVTRVENLIQELRPDRITVALDSREKTFRHRLYPQYKAKRLAPPEELLEQIPLIKEYLEIRGIDCVEAPGFEADDIIARMARFHGESGHQVLIFSSDKDLFQLVEGSIYIFHPKLKQRLDSNGIKETFGVFPRQIVDYLSLVGDSSDNIPGVPGIGDKTAQKLIEKFGSLDEMLEKIDQVEEKHRKKISGNMELLNLSRKLVDLGNLPDFQVDVSPDTFKDTVGEDLASFYGKLSFNSLLKKMETFSQKEDRPETGIDYRIVKSPGELKELQKKIIEKKYFAFDLETTHIDFFRSRLVGLSISFKEEGYYIPFIVPPKDAGDITFTFPDFKEEMAGVFGDKTIKKTGHNLKFDILHLKQEGMEVAGVAEDSMIMSYLLFPNRRAHNLKELTKEFLDYRQVQYEELTGKGKNQLPLFEIEMEKVGHYCIDDSLFSLKLAELLKKEIEKNQLLQLYQDIEIPLVKVLADVEFFGVKVDVEFLKSASRKMQEKLMEIESEIFKAAGYEFNLNSSQQLGELLFEKMNLPVKKRTRKTRSYSTDIEVLKELRGFPVVEKIIDYRTYKKLLSTYLEGLIDDIDRGGRVHTSFNQTVTATGRLSSSNPNLQNIPVGESGGINIRRAFVPEEGKLLVSTDYSQIELRVMAHFSRDQNLLDAFKGDFDIHRHTADLVFAKDLFMDDREKRKRAKIINFSILYGSGPFSLSRELQVSYREAKAFIDRYFEKYSGVKDFIDRVIREAEAVQQVKTISGRIRQIPEIVSSNNTVKENGKRMAINTIIQGSAADIIKIAMINIHRQIGGMQSQLIMQVHDELVFEYPPEEETQLFQIVKREMENALPLDVPLKVTLKKGRNWGEMQEIVL